MSGILNLRARREGTSMSHEQAQTVQFTLQSLTPAFSRLQRQQHRGLSHRSSVPSFFSNTPPTSETLHEGKVHHHSSRSSSLYQSTGTSPIPSSAMVTQSQSHPVLSALRLSLPLLPRPPPPAMRKQRRFSILSPNLEMLPELVFGVDPVDMDVRKACDGVQINSFAPVDITANEHEDATCGLHISRAKEWNGDHHRPSSVPATQNSESRMAPQNCATWTLERNGQRTTIKEDDYQDVLDFLRRL